MDGGGGDAPESRDDLPHGEDFSKQKGLVALSPWGDVAIPPFRAKGTSGTFTLGKCYLHPALEGLFCALTSREKMN